MTFKLTPSIQLKRLELDPTSDVIQYNFFHQCSNKKHAVTTYVNGQYITKHYRTVKLAIASIDDQVSLHNEES